MSSKSLENEFTNLFIKRKKENIYSFLIPWFWPSQPAAPLAPAGP
jgi:hypothetical protein